MKSQNDNSRPKTHTTVPISTNSDVDLSNAQDQSAAALKLSLEMIKHSRQNIKYARTKTSWK